MIIKDATKCEQCGQTAIPSSTFLCKGKMVCESCYMIETKGNTIAFDESKYPRQEH